ncbi:MAG: signal peptidase I [Gaiellales bacterium]
MLIGLAVTLVVLALLAVSNFWLYLWQISGAQGTFSMAPALPACSGQTLVEGFTYKFRDPHRGEIVAFHARGQIGGEITPDAHSRQLQINKRVIGVPGDTVVGRNNRLYVNGQKADDIPTRSFPAVNLGPKQYFVVGDNRSASYDSRDFGPVPRGAIYARAILIVWPFGRFGVPAYNKHAKPPGPLCGASP